MDDITEGVALRNMDNDSLSSQGTSRTVARTYYPMSYPTFKNKDELEQESKEVEEICLKLSKEFLTNQSDK
jgi:HEPN domain-containing protein